MISIGTPVALAAAVLCLISPAAATHDDNKAKLELALTSLFFSSPEEFARMLGGDGAAAPRMAAPVNMGREMLPGPSQQHSAMIFLAAVGAGALIGALIDGGDGAGKGVLLGAAAGAGYLLAVHF